MLKRRTLAIVIVPVLLMGGIVASNAPVIAAPTAPPDAVITFLAELPHRSIALQQAAQAISTPGHPQFRQHLSLRDAAEQFGASEAELTRLRKVARDLGLVANVDPTHLVVRLTGSVATWEKIMGTQVTFTPSETGNPYNSYVFAPIAIPTPVINDPNLWEAYYRIEGLALLDAPAALRSVVTRFSPAYTQYVPADDVPPAQQASGALAPDRQTDPRTLYFPGSTNQPVPANPAGALMKSCINQPGAPLAPETVLGVPATPSAFLGHNQVFAAYGLNGLQRTQGAAASGRVAILSWGGGFSDQDLADAAACFGFTKPKVNIALATGMSAPFVNVDDEATLDVQTVSATLANAKSIHVVQVPEGPGSGGWSLVDGYTRALALTPKPHSITTSYGFCEPLWATRGMFPTVESVFQFAGVVGTSIAVSSGDSGSAVCQVNFGQSLQQVLAMLADLPDARIQFQNDPAMLAELQAMEVELEQAVAELTPAVAYPRVTVAYPASSPYATAVGGTQMYLNPDGTRAGEVVWNDQPYAGGAIANLVGTGGTSSVFNAPWYQQPLSPSNTRSVPDIAAIAGVAPGLPFVFNGVISAVGGTSQASPMMASALALVSTREARAGRSPIGFANPWLYDMVRRHPVTAYDVTIGNNQFAVPYSLNGTNIAACCQADLGFDQTSGLGVLRFNEVLRRTVPR